MNSPILKTFTTLAACHLLAGHASALTPFSDNFNAAKLNTSRWTLKNFCTFSPTGKGGDRCGNWNLNPTSGRFGIRLFGYSERQSIAAGKVTLDNFALKAAK